MIHVDPALNDQGLEWLRGEAEESEIVLSTRVRVARNLQGYAFPIRASGEERKEVLERVKAAAQASDSLSEADMWRLGELANGERAILHERHLISRELVGESGAPPPAAALILAQDSVGMLVNEEDHLRLQALRPGFQLDRTWRVVDRLDEELGGLLPFAFHHEFGYLTSCPTNVGTGLRASMLIHLPGLVLTKEITRVLEGIAQVGLTYRGLYGEGSEIVGNFFQVSNQTTLGKSEEELVDHLARITGKVIEYEKSARAILLQEAPAVIEDKVWRAYGILRHARSLSADEMMNLLSAVRLGVSLKLLPMPRVETLNEIMVSGQRAHLERAAGGRLDDIEADFFRAGLVRERLTRDETDPSGAPPANERED